MTLPTSLHAYKPEFDAYERAKDSARGIRVEFPNTTKARAFTARLHNARVLDRKENRGIDKDSPMFGRSEFDCITVALREDTEGKAWVYLEKNEVIPGHVEEL